MKWPLSFLFISFYSLAQVPSWQWALDIGGNKQEIPYSVATDINNNVYAVGTFTSSTLIAGTTTLTNAGIKAIFIIKTDPSGNVLWARTATGTAMMQAVALGVNCDAAGNVYVCGAYGGSVTFGPYTLTPTWQDGFLVKYSSSGNVIWAKNISGSQYEQAMSVHTTSNSLYVVGYFDSDSLKLGTFSLATNSSGNGWNEGFIAKYDLNGNPIWVKGISGSMHDEVFSVTTDGTGNAFISGWSQSPSFTAGSFTLTNSSSNYIGFEAKYLASGICAWANSMQAKQGVAPLGIATDQNGNVYNVGRFLGDSLCFGNNGVSSFGWTNYLG